MCDRNMQLVKAIEKFPCIYNYTLPEYLKKDIADKAWNEVANITRQTVAECKEKWKNLRYGLLRSLRLNNDGTVKKKYYLHDEMEFVLPYMKTTKPQEIILQTEMEALETDEEITINENDIIGNSSYEVEYSDPSKKRSRFSENYVQNHRSNNNEKDDSRRMFLLSLLPEVNSLTEGQMRVFRRKVLTLLDDIVEDQYERIIFPWHRDSPNHQNNNIKPEPSS